MSSEINKRKGFLFALLLFVFAIIWLVINYLTNEYNNAVAAEQYYMICDKNFLLDAKNRQKFVNLESKLQSSEIDELEISLNEDRHEESNDLILMPVARSDHLFVNIIYLKVSGDKYLYFRDLILRNKTFFSGPIDDGYTWRSCFGEEKDKRIDAVINRF